MYTFKNKIYFSYTDEMLQTNCLDQSSGDSYPFTVLALIVVIYVFVLPYNTKRRSVIQDTVYHNGEQRILSSFLFFFRFDVSLECSTQV